MDKQAIEKGIKSIRNRGASLDRDIQNVGLGILEHVEKHGDTTLADKLFDAMPKGSRRVMLADWLCAFGKLRTLSNKDAADKDRIKAGAHFAFDKTRKTDLAGAAEMKWHDMRKEQSASEAYDVQAGVKRLLDKVSKGGCTVGPEALASARELVKTLEAIEAAMHDEAPL